MCGVTNTRGAATLFCWRAEPKMMLKGDYNRALALSKASIDGGFDLTTSRTSSESLPFVATQSLRRQMFSRWVTCCILVAGPYFSAITTFWASFAVLRRAR